MTKPRLEFTANSTAAGDESGVAIWRYTDARGVDIASRHTFASFRAVHAIHTVIEAAYWAGEAEGYARCGSEVAGALNSVPALVLAGKVGAT